MIRNRKRSLSAAAMAIAAVVPSFVQAADRYWDGGNANLAGAGDGISGGGNGTWNTTITNWDRFPAGQTRVAWVNANSDTAILGGSSGTVTLGTAITTGGLQFNVTGYTIAAATNTLTVNGMVTASGSQAVTLTGGTGGTVIFAGSTSNTLGGLITLSSTSGGAVLELQKTGSAQAIAGPLTIGVANNTIAQVKYNGSSSDMMGTGLVTINGRSRLDFNGATDTIGDVSIVNTGTTSAPVSIFNTAGTGNLTIGTLGITPAAGVLTTVDSGTSGTLTLGGTVTFTAATNGQARITGQTLSLGNSTRTFNVGLGTGSGQDLQVAAAVSGVSVGLTKTGTGRLALSGTNSYTGPTSVNAGTLLVNGSLHASSAVSVASPATLGGNGTINGSVNVASGGTLSPGAAAGTTSLGTVTLNSGVTLDAGSAYAWEHNAGNALGTAGTNFDVINVTSGSTGITATANTGSKLNLNFATGTSFSDNFWSTNRSWNIITGGVSSGNYFDTSNINVRVNGTAVDGGDYSITGEGSFSTIVSSSNVQLVWTSSVSSISLTTPSGTNRADVTNQTMTEGPGGTDNLTTDDAGTRVVHVTGSGNFYLSEIDGLRGTGSSNGEYNSGYVQVDTAIDSPTVILLWLTGGSAGNAADPSSPVASGLLGDLDAAGGGLYDLADSGSDTNLGSLWASLQSHYSGFNALVKFNSGMTTADAFDWDFAANPAVTIDRIAIVPEPATVGVLGLAAVGMIARRRRR